MQKKALKDSSCMENTNPCFGLQAKKRQHRWGRIGGGGEGEEGKKKVMRAEVRGPQRRFRTWVKPEVRTRQRSPKQSYPVLSP